MSKPKVYRIPVIWEMAGEVEFCAANLSEALELAENALTSDVWRSYLNTHQGSPIDDSLTVDLEGVAIRYPDEKHGQE